MYKRLICILLALSMLIATGCGEIKVNNWYDHRLCMHGLGVDSKGEFAFNSLEALRYCYKQGQRLFETDIQITTDGVCVLRHDWNMDLGQAEAFGWSDANTYPVTLDEFLNAPYSSGNAPCTLLDLYKEMSKKKDIYVIIDPKYSNDVAAQFGAIVNTAIDNGYEDVLDRIIVQLYYEDMYDEVEAVYHFKNYLFTLYMVGYYDGARIGNFCMEHNIPVVTIPENTFSGEIADELAGYGVIVYVHTIDDVTKARNLIVLDGAHGVYTNNMLNRDYFGE